MAKDKKWTEAEPTLLEIYNKKSPEEKKAFMANASPEEIKQLISDRAKAKIREGNRKLQEIKSKERKENNRKLILLGTLLKKLLLSTPQMFDIILPNIEQEIVEIKEDIQNEIEGIKKIESEYTGDDIKTDPDYRIWSKELAKDKKKLKDTEIIFSTLNTLKGQIPDQSDEDSDQSDSQDTPEQTQDLDQES